MSDKHTEETAVAPRRRDIKKARVDQKAHEDGGQAARAGIKQGTHEGAGQEARESAGTTRRKNRVRYTKPPKGNAASGARCWWSVPVTGVIVCVLAAVCVFSVGAFSRHRQFQQMKSRVQSSSFYPGITVDGTDVSGMTYEQAMSAWGERDLSERDACNVELTIGSEQWLLTAEDMHYTSDYREVLHSAWSVGRYGTFSQRVEEIEKTAGAWKQNYDVHYGYDEAVLTQRLSEIATQVSEPAVEASIEGFNEEKGFTVKPGQRGLVVDVHELRDQIDAAIQNGGGALTVERREVSPGRSAEDLEKLFGKIAQAKTDASSSTANRLTNLHLACEALNGLRLEPDEVFSFNQTLGKRTKAKGYKEAPALSSGSHTMEVGGGICQVSTTLFCAVSKAGMQIVKRYPHSIPSTYVSRGMDATVDWPNQDFRFRNTSDYPIYLSAKLTQDRKVVIAVYGRMLDEGIEYKLKSVTNASYSPGEPEYVYTSKLPTGATRRVENRRSGYRVTTYRIRSKNGKEIDREVLCKSTYASSGGVIEVGK